MLIALRDGLRLHVRDRGHGPPLLLLHGFMGSSQAWGEAVLEPLAAGNRVLAVDLLGHGLSDGPARPERFAFPEILSDLIDLLDALDIPRAAWIGYSMGGRLALGAAVLHPERVDQLVLESASPGLETEGERSARREHDEALARQLLDHGIEDFVDYWDHLPLFATRRRLPGELLAWHRAARLKLPPRSLAACLRGLGTGAQPSFWDALGTVRHPTLLINGEEDAKFRGIATRMTSLMPAASHMVIPAAGHTVHLENPAGWTDAVLEFRGRDHGWLRG